MELPKNHPDLESILLKQGLSKEAIEFLMLTIAGMVIEIGKNGPEIMNIIANGLLKYLQERKVWELTPEGMAFDNFCKENPKEVIEMIEKDIMLKNMMKGRMN